MFINRKAFVEKLETIHPSSRHYIPYWREIKRKCIEGIWIGGTYMPGVLYFYGNVWQINLMGDATSKNRSCGSPRLRDLEWEKFYYYLEARGFSGFSLDEEYTCLRDLKDYKSLSNDDKIRIKNNKRNATGFKLDGSPKIYQDAREYLRKIHKGNLGKPLLHNEAKNFMEIGSRRLGKTECLAGTIAHNFLTDGYTDYSDYEQHRANKTFQLSESMIGAIDTKYSKKVVASINFGIDNLPGGGLYNLKRFPSPLHKTYQGSIRTSGNYIEASREVKTEGGWTTQGSRSKIYHVTFGDSAFAGNGTGSTLIVIDEVGFMHNLRDVLGALKDSTMDMAVGKFGTIWLSGTSGDIVGGSSLESQHVFYNPEEYDILTFDDEWDNTGKIGCFLSAAYSMETFKDDNGYTDVPAAIKHLEIERDKARKAKDPTILNNLLQYRPLRPSEAFLDLEGNRFPITRLKDRKAEILSKKVLQQSILCVDLFEKNGIVQMKDSDKIPLRKFRYTKGDNLDCPVEILSLPKKLDGKIQTGRYLASFDPIDDDDSTGESLMSGHVMDSFTDQIVAHYTAKTRLVKEGYEQMRLLIKLYGATCLYEKNKKGFFTYMDSKNSLYLLEDTPQFLSDMDIQRISTTGNQKKGVNVAGTKLKSWTLDLALSWLETQYPLDPNDCNLDMLWEVGLIDEFIAYNDDLNTDRISSMLMLMIHRENNLKHLDKKIQKQHKKVDSAIKFFDAHYNNLRNTFKFL